MNKHTRYVEKVDNCLLFSLSRVLFIGNYKLSNIIT